MSKSFFAERRGFVEDRARRTDVPVVVVAPRNTGRPRLERGAMDKGDRPERRTRFRKGGEVKQLANKSINYSAFVIATLIPAAWLLSANLLQFALSGQLFLSPYRLVAVATGVAWGCIVAWATDVPQGVYFYRPGGRNKKQRRLFVMSAIGIFLSAFPFTIFGFVPTSP